MRITIEPTGQIVEINGVSCRVWTGRTETGTRCDLFIARVAVPNEEGAEAQAVFARQLIEKVAPSAAATQAWPSRLLWPDDE